MARQNSSHDKGLQLTVETEGGCLWLLELLAFTDKLCLLLKTNKQIKVCILSSEGIAFEDNLFLGNQNHPHLTSVEGSNLWQQINALARIQKKNAYAHSITAII